MTGMSFDFPLITSISPPFMYVYGACGAQFHFLDTYVPSLLTRRIEKKVLKSFADLYRCQHITLPPEINLPVKQSRAA